MGIFSALGGILGRVGRAVLGGGGVGRTVVLSGAAGAAGAALTGGRRAGGRRRRSRQRITQREMTELMMLRTVLGPRSDALKLAAIKMLDRG